MPIIHTIPQNHCVMIERFGKFSKVQQHGLNFCIPILDKIKSLPEWNGEATKQGYLIELSEQQSDTKPRQAQTNDNVTVTADAVVYWRISDPIKAVYNVDILPRSIRDSALNALRGNIGAFTLDQILSQRQVLNERISAQLSEIAQKWGVVITRVEIQELQYDKSTQEAMLQQMTAERKKRAKIAEAEGEAQSAVMTAKAKAEAAVLQAQGQAQAVQIMAKAEADYLKSLAQAVDAKTAGQLLAAQKYLTSLESITKNESHKVFIPNNMNAFFPMADSPNS